MNPHIRTLRTSAVAVALGLLALSAAFVAAGVEAAASGRDRPARDASTDLREPGRDRGDDRWPPWRPSGIIVRVGVAGDNDSIDPAANATITFTRPGHDEPAKTLQTNENGAARTLMRPGAYIVEVQYGNLTGSTDLVIRGLMRLGVYFDADGVAHFFPLERSDVPRGHRPHLLLVRVTHEGPNATREPLAGALVTVTQGPDANASRSKETGERGLAAFLLPRGRYHVSVVSGDLAAKAIVEIGRHGEALCVHFAADGTATVNEECHPRLARAAADA